MANPQAAMNKYARRTGEVTLDRYCRKQVQMGVPQDICAQRFENYRAGVQGKASDWLAGYTGR